MQLELKWSRLSVAKMMVYARDFQAKAGNEILNERKFVAHCVVRAKVFWFRRFRLLIES